MIKNKSSWAERIFRRQNRGQCRPPTAFLREQPLPMY